MSEFSASICPESAQGAFSARIPGGEFQFQIDRADLPFPDLCGVAVRLNPRRRFLFVGRVIGRHCPVRPAVLREIAARLAAKIAGRGTGDSAVFIGMAETATTLGQAVFREWRRMGMNGLYIESTRRPTGGPIAFRFSESHSHASVHLVHQPGPDDDPEGWARYARQVVIVDDEATTGATAANLARALREWRALGEPRDVCLATVLKWMTLADSSPELNDFVSIAEGSFDFNPQGDPPASPAPRDEIGRSVPTRRGARHGVREPEGIPSNWDAFARPAEKILVLGNGEHGFRPLVFAEALEKEGAEAWVQATTRSPILPGGAIGHVRHFPALSGEDHLEYLYNVPEDHPYDRVILCTEDAPPPSDHPIWLIPRLEVRA